MLCVEHFLELSQLLVELLGLTRLLVLPTMETGGVVGVVLFEVYFVSWLDRVTASVEIVCQVDGRLFRNKFLDAFP